MATDSSAVSWGLLTVWICLCCQLVTSQTPPQVLPPGSGSNVTNAISMGNTTSAPSLPRVDRNKTVTALPDNTTEQKPPSYCSLVSVYHVRDTLQGFLISGAKLIELDLSLQNYPPDFLNHRLSGVFSPHHWVRSTGRQGRSLLVLEDNYDFMSLFFLSIGVVSMNVTLTDSPKGCMRSLDAAQTIAAFRDLLLNDFKPKGQGPGDGSLSVDEHVCNMKVKDDDGYADFVYTCCHKSPDDNVVCSDVTNDGWINVLMAFIVITKVLVVLYSPSFLPGSLYRLKYVAAEYIYHLPDASPVKRINVVVTQFPSTYGNNDKVVRLSEVNGMEYFKTMVDTNMHLDRIYQVALDRVRLSVKSRRLLGENYVPVGFIKTLYNNFFRCRIRRLAPLKDCCDTDLLGRLNPGLRVLKWSACVRALAKLLLLLLLILPWVLRVWVFFAFEDATVMEKLEAADQLGLNTYFKGSLTLYLTPLHAFFVVIYVIIVVDSVVYGILSKTMKEKFKMVLRKCLRDMRERSRVAVCAWGTRLLVVPFTMFGLVGVLLFPLYLVLVLPFALPVVAFYLFPALNLSVRLIIHFFLFMCPAKMLDRWERFSSRFSRVHEQLDMNKIVAGETFERGNTLKKKDIGLQIVVILMCLVSFWSLTFLLMEVVSFFVEVAVYTLMGIIVNAGATMQYVTVAFLTLMYGRATFNDVYNTYLTYHKEIHAMLLKMKREEIDEIARKEALEQENTSLRVQGDMAPPNEEKDARLIVKNGQPTWRTSSMLMFLDRRDTPYTPEKFFYDAITLNYCGAPGPLYLHFISAFWSFSRILLFLFFVFVVVMAFGDAYSVSTTNQLLATVAGGFIPFLFRYVFSPAGGVPSLHTDSVQFRSQFHQAINRYMQNWPVYDIIPIHFGELNPRSSLVLNSTALIGAPQPSTATNHGWDASHVAEAGGDEEKVDLDFGYDDGDNAEDGGGIDMVIDVSTPDSRRRGLMGMGEAGSMSMLGADSFNRSAGSSARIYRPPAVYSERRIDV